jgi:hypothetical protein
MRPKGRVAALLAALSLNAASAAPLGDLIGVLDRVCGVQAPPAILEAIGGESTQRALCAIRDLAVRAGGLAQAATAGTAAFLQQALDEGFGLLKATVGAGTDLGALEDLIADLRGTLGEGVSYEALMGFLSHRVASERIARLGEASTAEPGSARWFVEENLRLNPGAANAELDSILRSTDLQARMAQSVELAQQAGQVASDGVQRGDEAALTLNVTNPNPLEPGIADRAAERARTATSTRAAVQLMLDVQAEALRQRALETTSLLTAIKEQNVQQGYTVKQLSLIARQLYDEQVRRENEWREAHRLEIEGDLARAHQLGEGFEVAAGAFRSVARQLGGAE